MRRACRAPSDVADLAFEHVDDRVAAEVGVRPVEHEEVREPGHGDAEVGLSPVPPGLPQRPAAAAGHLHRGEELRGTEAGAVDDHVGGVGRAVGGDHAVRDDPLDPLGDQLHVRPGQGRVPVVGEHHPLAAHHVVRHAPGAQLGVGDRGAELAPPHRHRRGQQLGRQDEAAGEQLAVEEDAQPFGLAHGRHPVEQGQLAVPVGPVGLGQHVRGAALVDVDVGGHLGDLGHELDGAGPGADHGHPPAGQVDLVVPAGRVPRGAGEVVPAGDIGQHGLTELADGADDRGRLQGFAVAEGEGPPRLVLVELGVRDPGAEAQVRAQAVLGDQRVQVGQDLIARREAPGPAPGPERERVELRRYVAGQPGIAVVAPGPAQVIGPVQDHEVLEARPLERDRHADPAEAGADDDHLVRHEPSFGLTSSPR